MGPADQELLAVDHEPQGVDDWAGLGHTSV